MTDQTLKTKKEVADEECDWRISLKKLLPEGVTIVDITGYLTTDFGDPVFKLCDVKLSNGSEFGVEGEHDLPYLTDGRNVISEEQMRALANEDES